MKIVYWDPDQKVQVERDATAGEIAEINAAKTQPKPIPYSVGRKYARLAMLNARKFHLIQPAIDKMAEPGRTRAQIDWDDSLTYERDDPTVMLLAEAIGLDDDALDALFVAADALSKAAAQ